MTWPGAMVNVVSDNTFVDEWGVRWHKLEGGHYYVERAPFATEATPKTVEGYNWPGAEDLVRLDGLAEAIRKVRSETDEFAKVESEPKLEGRQMVMVLTPR